MDCLVIQSGKGGVGKSSIAASIAIQLAKQGCRVAALDADTSAPDLLAVFGIETAEIQVDQTKRKLEPLDLGNGVKVFSIAMSFPQDVGITWSDEQRIRYFESALVDVDWDADWLIIDAAPGFTPEISFLRKTVKHEAIIIVSPASTSLLDSSKLIRQLKRQKVPIFGLIENLSEHRCICGRTSSPFGSTDTKAFAEKYSVRHLGKIPFQDSDGQPLKTMVNDATIEAIGQELTHRAKPLWAKLLRR